MKNIQYLTSEDQHGGHFITIFYDVHTYHWWGCDEEITSIVVTEDIYSNSPTEGSI